MRALRSRPDLERYPSGYLDPRADLFAMLRSNRMPPSLFVQLSAQAQLIVHAEQQLAEVHDEQRRLTAWSSELVAKEEQLAAMAGATERQAAELEAEKARYDQGMLCVICPRSLVSL